MRGASGGLRVKRSLVLQGDLRAANGSRFNPAGYFANAGSVVNVWATGMRMPSAPI
jgi:hypothetical protein